MYANQSFRFQPLMRRASHGGAGCFVVPVVGPLCSRRPSLEGLGATCVSIVLAGSGRAEDRWGATFGRPQFWCRPFFRLQLPPNEDGQLLPVEILPLQAHDFTGAKAKTCRNHNHRVVWLDQLRQGGGFRPASARAVCIGDRPAVVPGRWDFDRSVPIVVHAHR